MTRRKTGTSPTTQRLRVVFQSAFVALLFLGLPQPGSACSLYACVNDGIELAKDFDLVITHEGKPLPGVTVRIKRNVPGLPAVLTVVTDLKGVARVNLTPGSYYLDAEFLGFSAAYYCFHVNQQKSGKAKRSVEYRWSEFARVTRNIVGSLIDSPPETGGSPLWNAIHSVKVPIAGAQLRLLNAITQETFNTTSDALGLFDFGSVPDGTYVLRIEGGTTGRGYSPTELLLKVRRKGPADALYFSRIEPMCGDPQLWLSTKPQ
jgi:hypothetical protein